MAAHSLTVESRVGFARRSAADRTLYVLWAVFWALMILIAIQDHLHIKGTNWWEPVLWEGSSGLMATFWFVLQRRVEPACRRYLDTPWLWFVHHFKWLPLVITSFIVIVYGLRHTVYRVLGERYEHESWLFVVPYESIKLLLFAGLWLGIAFGFSSFEQRRRDREQLALLQQSLAEAQLLQLKAQLRPHFLFNALNTISALMQTDVDRADRLLARLSELLRGTLQIGEQERVALRDELRLLALYAQIMQERFTDRVEVEWRVDEAAARALVPALILQPLLENAFKHGVERSRTRVRIVIEARREGRELQLAVTNTGVLRTSDATGVGLRNTRERLRVMYGDAARFDLTQQQDIVVAKLRLPFIEGAA